MLGAMPSSKGQEGQGSSKVAKNDPVVENGEVPRARWSLKGGGSSRPEGGDIARVGNSFNCLEQVATQTALIIADIF